MWVSELVIEPHHSPWGRGECGNVRHTQTPLGLPVCSRDLSSKSEAQPSCSEASRNPAACTWEEQNKQQSKLMKWELSEQQRESEYRTGRGSHLGNSLRDLVVRIPGHCYGLGSISGQGTETPQAMGSSQLKKKDNLRVGGKRSIQTIQQSLAVSCWSMAGKEVREDQNGDPGPRKLQDLREKS